VGRTSTAETTGLVNADQGTCIGEARDSLMCGRLCLTLFDMKAGMLAVRLDEGLSDLPTAGATRRSASRE